MEESSKQVTTSSKIPNLDDTIELGHLSAMVYGFHRQHSDCSAFPEIYQNYMNKYQPSVFIHSNATFTCHLYERDEQDTQVLLLSKEIAKGQQGQGYIAVIYAGTDDFRTMLTDTDILMKTFGTTGDNGTHPLVPPGRDDIRVHAGFNNAVFKLGLFDRIKQQVHAIKGDHPNYRLLTTGHSLGAADAVLTAVALKLEQDWKDELVLSINYGCPKTGNRAWREYVNEMDGLGIWRVVNGLDLAARLPGPTFHHVGHTLQLDGSIARVFWLHDGDKKLGFRGVPFGWNTLPYALAPAAAYEHFISHYTRYLEDYSAKDSATFYVDSFERIGGGGQDDDGTPDVTDDDDGWMPDDLIPEEISEEEHANAVVFAEKYLELVQQQVGSGELDQSRAYTTIA